MSRATLIGLAHGSRHPAVAAGLDSLLATVTAQTGVATRSAFLDLTAPDLGTVTGALAGQAAQPTDRTAVVVPLLFTDAFHARTDVPAAVRGAAASSGLDLLLADILGTGDDVLEVLVARLAAAGTDPAEPVLLYAVGSSRAEANASVADLAARLEHRRAGAAVRVGFGTCAPRAADVLGELTSTTDRPGAVLPLFVAPGLLLDHIAADVLSSGWRLADPLGDLLAPVVSRRYAAAVRRPHRLH